eukprot:2350005-Pleurochrysis_carterae.AAC.2
MRDEDLTKLHNTSQRLPQALSANCQARTVSPTVCRGGCDDLIHHALHRLDARSVRALLRPVPEPSARLLTSAQRCLKDGGLTNNFSYCVASSMF